MTLGVAERVCTGGCRISVHLPLACVRNVCVALLTPVPGRMSSFTSGDARAAFSDETPSALAGDEARTPASLLSPPSVLEEEEDDKVTAVEVSVAPLNVKIGGPTRRGLGFSPLPRDSQQGAGTRGSSRTGGVVTAAQRTTDSFVESVDVGQVEIVVDGTLRVDDTLTPGETPKSTPRETPATSASLRQRSHSPRVHAEGAGAAIQRRTENSRGSGEWDLPTAQGLPITKIICTLVLCAGLAYSFLPWWEYANYDLASSALGVALLCMLIAFGMAYCSRNHGIIVWAWHVCILLSVSTQFFFAKQREAPQVQIARLSRAHEPT